LTQSSCIQSAMRRTSLPNCPQVFIRSKASLPPASGKTASMTGFMPWRATASSMPAKSSGEPIVEPIRFSCFQKTFRSSRPPGAPAVGAKYHRTPDTGVEALRHPIIPAVQRGRLQLHQHLTATRRRRRLVRKVQRFMRLVQHKRLHGRILLSSLGHSLICRDEGIFHLPGPGSGVLYRHGPGAHA